MRKWLVSGFSLVGVFWLSMCIMVLVLVLYMMLVRYVLNGLELFLLR